MDIYREFIIQLRNCELDEFTVQVNEDLSPKLKHFVKLLNFTKYKDGALQIYYGGLKECINCFTLFWSDSIDELIKKVDKLCNSVSKDELLVLIEKNIQIQNKKQTDFAKEYLPLKPPEQAIYDDVASKYKEHMEKLQEIKVKVEHFDKPEYAQEFAKENFYKSLRKTYDLFEYCHIYLALTLADKLDKIRGSLADILVRLRKNERDLQDASDASTNHLLHELFSRNQEFLAVRRELQHSVELAEIQEDITKLRSRLDVDAHENALAQINEELDYWQGKMEDFQEIAGGLKMLKKEFAHIVQEEKTYHSMQCYELEGSKKDAFEKMGVNLKHQKEYLKEKIISAAKVLMTHFCIRGTNNTYYKDDTGTYIVDVYGHKMYVFDSGLRVYHAKASDEGTIFKQFNDHLHPYFRDQHGRYILQDGRRVYERAPCGSQYTLDRTGLFVKTRPSGYQEKEVYTEEVLVPDVKDVDMRKTLPSDAVKYLWDTLGAVLPEALHRVAVTQPKNPIHYLAHRILMNKYGKTPKEMKIKKKEAATYRKDVLKLREEKAAAATKAWKSRQVQPRKPEESDDTLEWAAYNTSVGAGLFAMQLKDFFCD